MTSKKAFLQEAAFGKRPGGGGKQRNGEQLRGEWTRSSESPRVKRSRSQSHPHPAHRQGLEQPLSVPPLALGISCIMTLTFYKREENLIIIKILTALTDVIGLPTHFLFCSDTSPSLFQSSETPEALLPVSCLNNPSCLRGKMCTGHMTDHALIT